MMISPGAWHWWKNNGILRGIVIIDGGAANEPQPQSFLEREEANCGDGSLAAQGSIVDSPCVSTAIMV